MNARLNQKYSAYAKNHSVPDQIPVFLFIIMAFSMIILIIADRESSILENLFDEENEASKAILKLGQA